MNILINNCITDNINGSTELSVEHEYYNNKFFSDFVINDIYEIFNNCIIIPVFRLYLLDDEENILYDISPDFINGNLQCTYQSGTRRTLSINLINNNSKYTQSNSLTYLYFGRKFRLDAGIVVNKDIYWFQQGVFLMQDPNISCDDSKQTINVSLSDKFSLFDGTINGSTSMKVILPVGVPMKQAFINILTADKGNNEPFDKKPILFNSALSTVNTQKTIKLDFGANIGDVLLDSAKTISSDVYYNIHGNMTVESNVQEFLSSNFPVIFRINENDKILRNCSMTYNWSKLRNKIIIKGAIKDGYQFSDSAENSNIMSPFSSRNKTIGIRAEVITNSKLYADSLCKEQAMYTLIEKQRGVKSLSLSCGYIPFLDVNRSVLINLPNLNLFNSNFIIDSFSMNISDDPSVSINLTNMGEVIF